MRDGQTTVASIELAQLNEKYGKETVKQAFIASWIRRELGNYKNLLRAESYLQEVTMETTQRLTEDIIAPKPPK